MPSQRIASEFSYPRCRRFASGLALIALVSSANAATYTVFDPIGSRNTRAMSINRSGEITGYYDAGDFNAHGFVRAPDGTISTFDIPGETRTYPISIDDKGGVGGHYESLNQGLPERGFVRSSDGTITTFDASRSNRGTYSVGGNGKGWIVGQFVRARYGRYGFVRTAHGRIWSLHFPGSSRTWTFGISGTGAVTGSYVLNDAAHGFLRNPDGTFVSFDPPGSIGTWGKCINRDGTIAGDYQDESHRTLGFVRDSDGSITTFDPLGSGAADPVSMNDHGAIAGSYSSQGVVHAFVRTPEGAIESFDPPGAVSTFVTSINSKGVITGFFYDADNDVHGFVRNP